MGGINTTAIGNIRERNIIYTTVYLFNMRKQFLIEQFQICREMSVEFSVITKTCIVYHSKHHLVHILFKY